MTDDQPTDPSALPAPQSLTRVWTALALFLTVLTGSFGGLVALIGSPSPWLLAGFVILIAGANAGAIWRVSTFVRNNQIDGRHAVARLTKDLVTAKKDLSQEAHRSRAIVNHIVDGIVIIDSSGTILAANHAITNIFGYQPDQLIGSNVKMLAAEDDRSRHDTYLTNYLATGEQKIIGRPRQVTGYRVDGTKFPVDLAVTEMTLDGNRQFVGVLRDLTEQVALEDQLRHAQKMESVGQLTGGLAHDFNNLLAVIRGNLGLLRSDFDDGIKDCDIAEASQLCDGAIHAAEKGADLTRSLLAFSRKQTLQPQTFDANDALKGMETLLHRTLGETIDLRFVAKQGGWLVDADRAQLESAVLNLAVNARDALGQGGALTIETRDVALDEHYAAVHEEVTAGDYVLVAVSDDGPGIPKHLLERVLEPFFTTKEVGHGSGLGLSMIYGFAKQSRGHLSIYSEEDKGTTVKLYLPRAQSDQAPLEPDTKSASKPKAGHENILVVEDDDDLRLTVKRILSRRGYQVWVACDGAEALKILHTNDAIELILSDVILPGGLTGPQLAERVESLGLNIPTLFMSGYTKTAIVHRGDLEGDFHLINKPFSPQELNDKVRELLDVD